jgi:hypothetical protein
VNVAGGASGPAVSVTVVADEVRPVLSATVTVMPALVAGAAGPGQE